MNSRQIFSQWLASIVIAAVLSPMTVVSSAQAFEGPLKDASELAGPIQQPVKQVRSARIMKANYKLIRRDFPSLSVKTNDEIDAMLLQSAGKISTTQTRPNDVNTPIEVAGDESFALRPKAYGRALVFPFEDGFLDVKGAGAISPSQKSHQNGLVYLHEAIREYLYEGLVGRILGHEAFAPGTVETYAVIDYGFDIIYPDGSTVPAGAIVRQAHARKVAAGTMNYKIAETFERIFRKYGILSDVSQLDQPYQLITGNNVQEAKGGNILDFGAFITLGQNAKLNSSAVNPDPSLRLTDPRWVSTDPNGGTRDMVEHASYDLVMKWRRGEASRSDVDHFIDERLQPLDQKYRMSCKLAF